MSNEPLVKPKPSFFDEMNNRPKTKRLNPFDLGEGQERTDFRNHRRDMRDVGMDVGSGDPFAMFTNFMKQQQEGGMKENEQLFQQQQQVMNQMGNEGMLGGIRDSPRNMGGRLNPGVDGLRTPQERIDRIKGSHAEAEARKMIQADPQIAKDEALNMLKSPESNPFQAPQAPAEQPQIPVGIPMTPAQSTLSPDSVAPVETPVFSDSPSQPTPAPVAPEVDIEAEVKKQVAEGIAPEVATDNLVKQGVITPDAAMQYELEFLRQQEDQVEQQQAPPATPEQVQQMESLFDSLVAQGNMSPDEKLQRMQEFTGGNYQPQEDPGYLNSRLNPEQNEVMNNMTPEERAKFIQDAITDPNLMDPLGIVPENFRIEGLVPSLVSILDDGQAGIRELVTPAIMGEESGADEAAKERLRARQIIQHIQRTNPF